VKRLPRLSSPLQSAYLSLNGWVAERLKAPVLKTGRRATVSWVRIPPHPPNAIPAGSEPIRQNPSNAVFFQATPSGLFRRCPVCSSSVLWVGPWADGGATMAGHNKLSAAGMNARKKQGRYADGLGLYLQVSSAGTKSWLFRFQRDRKPRQMGLGPLHTVSLADARQQAAQARRMLLDGIDPIQARQTARAQARTDAAKGITFRQCAERYIAAHEAAWRNDKHRAQRQAPGAMEEHPRDLLPSDLRGSARRRDRHRPRPEGTGADMDVEARDGEPRPRPGRIGPRLGDGSRLPQRREPGALAGSSR
jgi:hypothetical protein